METDTNHVHILLSYDPKISVSIISKYLKQYSTYHLWKKYDKYLSKQYWKKKLLWSDGYFVDLCRYRHKSTYTDKMIMPIKLK